MRIELYDTYGHSFISELAAEVLPRIGEVFVYDYRTYTVLEVVHNYDNGKIKILGERNF